MIELFACYKKSILLTLLSYTCFFLSGQFWPSHEDIYNEAEEYLFSEEYNEALSLYEMLLEKGYNTANIKYKIGKCYLNIQGQRLKALPYLKEAADKASKKHYKNELKETNAPISSIYFLAISYRLHNNLDKAIETFNTIKDSLEIFDLENREIIDMQIKRCINAQELINNPINLKEEKLDDIINSHFSNFNPLLTADESVIFYMDKLRFYNAVMQSVKTDGYWMKPVNLTPKIKSDGDFNIVGISSNGERILLYAFNPLTSGDIYQSAFSKNKWSRITRLNDQINTIYNETHASLSSDGKVLYFTSNRDGGYGGLDIYKSVLDENGEWGPATNLGPRINTAFDEESPFVTENGKKLYFGSQGHYNMGGFDLFYSELSENGEWSYPVNIGFPLNTTDDDVFFYPVSNGTEGYHPKFKGGERTDQDIYKYKILSIANPAKYIISGVVQSPDSIEYEMNKVSVTFIDSENNDTLITKSCTREGKYQHKVTAGKYELTFNSMGQKFTSQKINIPLNFPEEELIINTKLDTALITEPEVKLVAKKDTFFIDDIFFAFDSYALNKEALKFLDRLIRFLAIHPELLIQINGFTDSIGPSQYNDILSVNRAKSVGNYLGNNNLGAERYTIQGFGETRHKAVNSTAEGRQINRRVEIQITNPDENLIIIHSFIVPDHLAVD
jgi:outer membrane protein OmpA-like peptidoglycan-associated protein/tetratricopeptide (TPR) repeat protein